MEKVVRKGRLGDEPVPPLIEDRERAIQTFVEILRRGQSLYPNNGTTEGFARVYRIIPLSQS
jgi:hypothetical protein